MSTSFKFRKKEALETFKGGRSPLEDVVKQEGATIINGINILRIPSRDAYSYGLRLMDIIFSKEEMGKSLLFKSKKSQKPALDGEKVQQLLGLIDQKYGDKNWDIKTLTAQVNQKCRDSSGSASTSAP